MTLHNVFVAVHNWLTARCDFTDLKRTDEPWISLSSSNFYCPSSFLRRPPFIKVNEKFQLNAFITSTTTPTVRMICLILVEPSVDFNPSSQKFKTHGGLFPPSKLSLGATATQIFTFCPSQLKLL